MKRILFLTVILGVFLLTSCLGTAVHTTFNNDGSGILSMEVTVSQVFMEMGSGEDDAGDLPLSNEQIASDMGTLPGVRVVDTSEEVTEEFTRFRTVMEFDDFSVFVDSETMGDSNLVRNGSDWVYTMIISEGGDTDDEAMDEETKAMMAPYFEGYEIRFTITAPKKIKSHSLGELSADKKTVSFGIPTFDMNTAMGPDPVVMEVVW